LGASRVKKKPTQVARTRGVFDSTIF